MPQMLRLSQGHWLNLDTIAYVEDGPHRLEVTFNFSVADEHGYMSAFCLTFAGEERDQLLTWLAHSASAFTYPQPHNDDESEPPF